MYRKPDRHQLTFTDFTLPFGGSLDPENRWVKMSKLMPWDMVEDIYASTFKGDSTDGRPPIPARIAFGALYIKENENFPQERTMQHISENVYMQYFLGLAEFNPNPLFDPSMLSRIAARFTKADISAINEELYRRTHPPKDGPPGGGSPDNVDATDAAGTNNNGTLILDATVAPADIRYPTDLSLLNECRENTESMMDDLWHLTDRVGHKTPYSRKRVRGEYLRVAKQRKPRRGQVRQAIRMQLECVEKNIVRLDDIMAGLGADPLVLKHMARLMVIRTIAGQQRFHYDNPKEQVPDRIVSVRQPHVRPMVRGKAGTPVEFGQKLGLSVVDGFTFIDEQCFRNFAEGNTLRASAEKFKRRHGVYPKAILADKTYRNRDNINFCKGNGIRLSGPRLGRPKVSELEADREQAYRDGCERNMVEGRIGVNKRRYGLDLIYARLEQTGEVEAAMNILCMNMAFALKIFLFSFSRRYFSLFLAVLDRYGKLSRHLYGQDCRQMVMV
jgi:hypothetical protein